MEQTQFSKVINTFFVFIVIFSFIVLPFKVGAASNTQVDIDYPKVNDRRGLESDIWHNNVHTFLFWTTLSNNFDFQVSSWYYHNRQLDNAVYIECAYLIDVYSGSVSQGTQVGTNIGGLSLEFSNQETRNIGGEDYKIVWHNNNSSNCSLRGNYNVSTPNTGYKAMNISIAQPPQNSRLLVANSAVFK